MSEPRVSSHNADELLLGLVAGVCGSIAAAGAVTWAAAQLVVLVHEQRLLDPGSGSWIDVASGLVDAPLDPSSAFAPVDVAHLPGGVGLYVVAAPLAVAAVTAGLLGWRVLARYVPIGKRGGRGNSRWASRWELHRLRPSDATCRLVLGTAHGQLVATEPYHSVVAFGPTGASKTTALVVPALLEHAGAVVALSTRMDMMRPTRRARERIGAVHVYDPLGISGETCAAWTPLRTCASWGEALRVAHALTSIATSGDQHDRFWTGMGRKLVSALLHAAALDDLTMREVVRWIDTRESEEVSEILTRHGARDALQSFTASQTRNERTLADIYASAELLLAAYSLPGMADVRPSESLDPRELIEQRATMYVIAPSEDQELLQPVLCALVKDIYRVALLRAEQQPSGVLDPGLLFVIDEAAQLTPLRDLAEIAATCRGYGIQLVTMFQDYAQVRARWGAKAPTIVNNHSAILLLPGQADHELLNLVAKLTGDRLESSLTTSRSSQGGASSSTSSRYRPLMSVHELRQLDDHTALLLYRNLRPVLLTLRPWYRTPTLMKRADAA